MLYDYAATSEVMHLIKEFDLVVVGQDNKARSQLSVEVKRRHQDMFFERTKLLKALGVKVVD